MLCRDNTCICKESALPAAWAAVRQLEVWELSMRRRIVIKNALMMQQLTNNRIGFGGLIAVFVRSRSKHGEAARPWVCGLSCKKFHMPPDSAGKQPLYIHIYIYR